MLPLNGSVLCMGRIAFLITFVKCYGSYGKCNMYLRECHLDWGLFWVHYNYFNNKQKLLASLLFLKYRIGPAPITPLLYGVPWFSDLFV